MESIEVFKSMYNSIAKTAMRHVEDKGSIPFELTSNNIRKTTKK